MDGGERVARFVPDPLPPTEGDPTVHENSIAEVATMLRVELEEPLGTARTTTDAAGIRWRGDPARP